MNYSKSDIDSLTSREMHTILNSSFLKYYNDMKEYNDLSKYALLGMWIIQILGGELDSLEDLIGPVPTMDIKKELNEMDLELIEFANKNNLKYAITSNGIKINV